jgi:uncharacterized membrane-anchored protein
MDVKPRAPANGPDAVANGSTSPSRHSPRGQGNRRVPEVTALFWVIKILTTAMGESTSDYLVHRLDPVVAVALGGVALAAALLVQFSVRRYLAPIYWSAVVMVAVFGTMVADVLHIKFGVPYQVSTGLFAIVLAVVFLAWHQSEATLSIHSIYTTRREAFYWAAVVSTFALGTALGDMTATTLHLGYFVSGVLFVGLIAVPALAFRFLNLNAILAFWSAYVLTRPLGASFADWMGKPHAVGGLAWGDGTVSFGLTVLIVGLVGYLTVTRRDGREQEPAPVSS